MHYRCHYCGKVLGNLNRGTVTQVRHMYFHTYPCYQSWRSQVGHDPQGD